MTIDQTLSKTPLDNGGECIDKQGQIWLSIYEDHHDLKVKSYNVPEINTAMVVSYTNIDGNLTEIFQRGTGNLAIEIEGEDLFVGDQTLTVSLHNLSSDPSVDDSNITLGSSEIFSQSSSVGVERRAGGGLFSGLFSDEEVIDIDLRETGPRACLTFKDLGEWGWLLMAAEWAGGRETAMLTGGVGCPCLVDGLRIPGDVDRLLCIQYPLMHKMYHREGEEALNKEQVKRLITRVLENSQEEVSVKIDFELLRMQESHFD